MAAVTERQILDALRQVRDSERGSDIVSLNMVSGIVIRDGNVGFAIEVEPERVPRGDPHVLRYDEHVRRHDERRRQLRRTDLSQRIRDHLLAAQRALWQAINATDIMQNSELWSWRFDDGNYDITAFGADAADKTESSAAQLWSTADLAIRPPGP